MTSLTVLGTGPLTTVQDFGRPGRGALGIGTSGACDRGAHRLANALVGNHPTLATLEVTLGGLELQTDADVVVVTTGARCPMDVVAAGGAAGAAAAGGAAGTAAASGAGGAAAAAAASGAVGRPRQAPHLAPFILGTGERLRLGSPAAGLRTYVAVRGGIDVAPVLGSRATDLLSGLGPAALTAGDVLPVGTTPRPLPGVDVAPAPEPTDEPLVAHVSPGPRRDWFDDPAWALLLSREWTAGSESNRVGVRLSGEPLPRSRAGELVSEGMLRGALQVPPSGLPVLFLADHPVTGGYPVIAYVSDEDVDRCAQLRPGQAVRFRPLP